MITGAQSSPLATVQIYHRFDLLEPSAYVRRADSQVDLPRAVAHIQFMAQHWFGPSAIVSNDGVGIALRVLYGFAPASPDGGEALDIYSTLESLRGAAHEVMSDPRLYRDGLRELIQNYLDV